MLLDKISKTTVISFLVLLLIKFFFSKIESGGIQITGFHKDWAEPTYHLVKLLIIVLTIIVIYPYLPGSKSPVFKGISVFIGVLFSLGSSSVMSNIISGVLLTYMRPFQPGDMVKISDTFGEVLEKNLLVTRIRNLKKVDITIPNSMVLNSHIMNFSFMAKREGIVLHTEITIGYDVPWRKVHQLLLEAAKASSYVLKEPEPFVLQTSLNDYHVTYELNVYTDQINAMPRVYSELHQFIQDKFNDAKIEIMSPQYTSLRDGEKITISEEYLS